MKRIFIILAAMVVSVSATAMLTACSGGISGTEEPGDGDGNEPGENGGGGEEKTYTALFRDSFYRAGFMVGSTDEANGAVQGVLDYDGAAAGEPFWLLAQWNNLNNDLLEGHYTFEGAKNRYYTDGGNVVEADTHDGTLFMYINTTSEYGLNGITNNPRRQNQPWPTLLVSCSLSEQEILKISDKQEIRMAMDFTVTDVEDHIPAGTYNPDLHSAQFQWFVTVQNRTWGSEEYGRYIWFGLNLFDKRYDYAPHFAAQDGGKENNTGAFIYMPDMREILSSQGKTEPGKKMSIDVDILPIIREAFALAQERNFLLGTTWEDLHIGSTNIGWEVPGTYNAGVLIDSFNINYR